MQFDNLYNNTENVVGAVFGFGFVLAIICHIARCLLLMLPINFTTDAEKKQSFLQFLTIRSAVVAILAFGLLMIWQFSHGVLERFHLVTPEPPHTEEYEPRDAL